MPRAIAVLLAAVLLVCLAPAQVLAWGFDIHRFVTERAIEALPPELKPFYAKHRVMVVEHSIDPDLWRSAGFEEEPPRHFVDLDAYGAWPFAALPRDYEQAVAAHGKAFVEKNGTLPWRVREIYDQLVKSFTEVAAGTSPWALDNVKFFSAVLAHYVGDAHVPFHAVLNYDGQLTDQHGIHSRFETDLFLRYRSRLKLTSPPLPRVNGPVDFVFDVLLDGFKYADVLLEADRAALGGGDTYDAAYFDRFFVAARPVLERQLSRASAGVAGIIVSAWEAGGRPNLSVTPNRPPRKKRTPAANSAPGQP